MSEYPRMMYQDGGGYKVVASEREEQELGDGWSRDPASCHFETRSPHHVIEVPDDAVPASAEDRMIERVMAKVCEEFAPLLEKRGPGRPRKDETNE